MKKTNNDNYKKLITYIYDSSFAGIYMADEECVIMGDYKAKLFYKLLPFYIKEIKKELQIEGITYLEELENKSIFYVSKDLYDAVALYIKAIGDIVFYFYHNEPLLYKKLLENKLSPESLVKRSLKLVKENIAHAINNEGDIFIILNENMEPLNYEGLYKLNLILK